MKKKQIYLALLFIPIIIGIAGFVALYNSPYTGLNFKQKENKWFISSIDSKSPAYNIHGLTGKEVVSIADRNIEYKDISTEMDTVHDQKEFLHLMSAKKYFSDRIKIGQPFSMIVKDGEQVISITITPTKTPLLTIISKIWGLLLTSLSFLIITAIIILRSNDPRGRIMLILVTSASLFYISSNILIHSSIGFNATIFTALDIMTALCIDYALVALWHFCIVFPKVSVFGKNRTILVLAYLSPILVFVLTYFRIYFPLYNMFATTLLLWGTGVLLYNYFTIESPVERAQARWVVWGLATFVILEIIFYFFPLLLTQKFILNQDILLLFGVLIPLGMAFAIMRYKLMDVDTIFDNTLIYSITIALLAIFDMMVVYILVWVKILQVFDLLTLIISIWLIILLYLPVRDFIAKWIKKVLKREIYDPNQVSLELSKKLLSVADIKEAFQATAKSIEESLHPKGSNAYFLKDNEITTLWEEKITSSCELEHTNTEPELLYQMCDIEKLPQDYSGGVYVPIKTGHNEIFGYLVLKNKQSQRLYDAEDLKLLNTLANQLVMAIEAINTREELKQKEIETIKEKNRIAREIHDGIGTNLVQLKLLMNMADKDENIKQKLTNLIDEGISEMRELIWVAEKDAVKLSELISYIESRLNQIQDVLPIQITTRMDNDKIVPAELKLNLIRLVQEAVTNILKHAKATKISVEFIQDDDKLAIKIIDNGQGFNTDLKQIGNGLRNMRKRCDEIGAKLNVSSTVNLGTTIQIEIELNRKI